MMNQCFRETKVVPRAYRRRLKFALISVLAVGIIPAYYILTVIWRVSYAEHLLFGRSYLIPLSLTNRQYLESPTPDSFGSPTYSYCVRGENIHVHKQLINGFQHAFGSALIAFELGEFWSDMIFRINEYGEAYFSKTGRTLNHVIDTRKDLANNKVGRSIGLAARRSQASGTDTENSMIEMTLTKMKTEEILPHFLHPKVQSLPSLEDFGCPGLPKPGDSCLFVALNFTP